MHMYKYVPLISFLTSIWLQYPCIAETTVSTKTPAAEAEADAEASAAAITTSTTSLTPTISATAIVKIKAIDLVRNKQMTELVNYLHIYGCSALVLFGCVGNLVSFLVFVRAGRRSPKIITRNTFIILTITNTMFLMLYWYVSVYPKMRNYFGSSTDGVHRILFGNNSALLLNTNRYFCKLIVYTVNVASYLNSSITVLFSVERALAINFPFKIRALREKKMSLFRMILLINFVFSFALPSYNLFLMELSVARKECDVPEKYQLTYFVLTVLFVIAILAIPFLLITVSNVSIVLAIYRNKQKREYYLTERISDASSIHSSKMSARRRHSKQQQQQHQHQSKCHDLLYYKTIAIKKSRKASTLSNVSSPTSRATTTTYKPSIDGGLSFIRDGPALEQHRKSSILTNCAREPSLISCSKVERKYTDIDSAPDSASKLIHANGDGSANQLANLLCMNKRDMSISYKYPKDKNLRVTKMLFTISASFMLLNFPHFISWTRYALYRLANHAEMDTNESVRVRTAYLYNIIKITETLNILNYSITSLLYFASGKIYRDHLYSMFECKVNSSSSLIVRKSSNRVKSLAN
jgi:hypothetical protein